LPSMMPSVAMLKISLVSGVSVVILSSGCLQWFKFGAAFLAYSLRCCR
jgi:hypothetical protein